MSWRPDPDEEAEFLALIETLPLPISNGSLSPLLGWLLAQLGLDFGFHVQVKGRFTPQPITTSVVNMPDDFIEHYSRGINNNKGLTDPLFHASFEHGFNRTYKSSEITPLYKGSDLDKFLSEKIEIADVITYGIRDRKSTHFVSLMTSDRFIDEVTEEKFSYYISLFWKNLDRKISSGSDNTLERMNFEKYAPKTINDLRVDFADFTARVTRLLDASETHVDGWQVLKEHEAEFRGMVEVYAEAPHEVWLRRCPALQDWDKSRKREVLRRVVDPATDRERYENAHEFLLRVLREAGVSNVPFQHELRQINPALLRSIYGLAQRRGESSTAYVPIAPSEVSGRKVSRST